jgi:glycosyltransferase involved in cell wall biosynthesis
MQTMYGLKKTPLWLPNYPSVRFSPAQRDPSLRRELLGNEPPADAILMVYPSIASPARLSLQLIEAFEMLPKRFRLLTFVNDDAYGAACREKIQGLSLQSRVTVKEPVPYEDLSRYLACCDIGAIFHDVTESSGYFMANPDRLAAYLPHGIPFVATAVPNLEAITYRNGLGLCCDPTHPEEIARAIRDLVEGSPGLDERRRAVNEAFRTELNLERHAESLAAEIRSLSTAGTSKGSE